MLTHKGGYLKYWNNDWKGKRVGRYDGAMECRHIVLTGNKVEKEVKQETLEVDANYFTTKLMKKSGIRTVVREELAESVLEVKRVSDRLIAMKLDVKGSILNIVSAYDPQVNNSMEEKNEKITKIHDYNTRNKKTLTCFIPRINKTF